MLDLPAGALATEDWGREIARRPPGRHDRSRLVVDGLGGPQS
jgi:hypothetical protein